MNNGPVRTGPFACQERRRSLSGAAGYRILYRATRADGLRYRRTGPFIR
jgi:hypothetical protein